ncbi:4020_t:CDS:1, partial [Ambispora leptoticha]
AAHFLAEKAADLVTAVDEWCHAPIVHLAIAMFVNDLLQQIKSECLSNILTSSAQWLRLQFWPKNPTYLTSLQYTGHLPLKFMVQTRQLCVDHPDSYYALAIFRYEKEFSIKFHDVATLVFLDDKHRCKIGEPGHPVAAVERRKV